MRYPSNPAELALQQASGWAGIDDIFQAAEATNAEQFAAMLELASSYRQAFTGEAGRRALEDLTDQFLFARVARPGDDLLSIGIRQGAQDVLRRILAMIDFANTGGGRVTGQPSNQE